MATFYCAQLDGDFGEVGRRCPSIAVVFLHVHSFYPMREEGMREKEREEGEEREEEKIDREDGMRWMCAGKKEARMEEKGRSVPTLYHCLAPPRLLTLVFLRGW